MTAFIVSHDELCTLESNTSNDAKIRHCAEYTDSHVHTIDVGYGEHSSSAKLLFSCTVRPSEWDRLIAVNDERIVHFYGTHPWYYREHDQKRLVTILQNDPKACVGEIGLDAKHGVLGEQMPVFLEQLALCEKYGRPANIHMVGCENEMLRVLRKTNVTAILHSFSGPESYIKPLTDCGCYFSISPRILRKSEKNIKSLLSVIPDDRLLLETDAPNTDIGIEEFLDKISVILDVETFDLKRIALRNAMYVFS
ncbi:MAG: TatD family hydrolase [archaeon]|nr:TatD family hydrolase [archaeon]